MYIYILIYIYTYNLCFCCGTWSKQPILEGHYEINREKTLGA